VAYTFPMAITDFFADVLITSSSFGLGEALEYAETGGGEILTADIGNRLWQMECEVAIDYFHQIEAVKAKLDVLRHAGRSLIAHPPYAFYPREDEGGALLGALSPSLVSVAANRRDIQIGGLPPGYILTAGDFLSFRYGSMPVRYALHQLARGGEADGNGVTGTMEVSSFVRSGYGLPTAVKLVKPEIKMVVKPGSVSSGKSDRLFTDGVKFTLVQTLR